MIGVLSGNTSLENYNIQSKSKDNNQDKGKDEKTHGKHIIVVREGNLYAKYLVDDNGGKILLCKVPADEEKNLKHLNNEECVKHLCICGEYKENMRDVTDTKKDSHDSVKDILKLVLYKTLI